MRHIVLNALATIAAAFVFIGFEFGLMSTANAFFAAATIVILYTSFLLTWREGQPLFATMKALLTEPKAHPRRSAYLTYIAVMAVGGLVLLQSTAQII